MIAASGGSHGVMQWSSDLWSTSQSPEPGCAQDSVAIRPRHSEHLPLETPCDNSREETTQQSVLSSEMVSVMSSCVL